MGRGGGSAGSSKESKTSNTTTKKGKKDTQVIIPRLEAGENKTYLCAHLCAASKTPRINKAGHRRFQQTMSMAIQAEAEANYGVWKYLAEVGYNMRTEKPMPLMSDTRKHRPSRFPLGAASKQIENMSKGAFRIPDITVLKVTEAEILAMRQSGVIDWAKFYPKQANIECIVEVKFERDKLSEAQIEAYQKIADGNLKELRDKDCCCETRQQPKPQPMPVFPPIQNPVPKEDHFLRPVNTALMPKSMAPGILGKILMLNKPQVSLYDKYATLDEYDKLMIPFIGVAGFGAMICGTVVLVGAGGAVITGASALGAVEATGIAITGFATLAHS